MNSEQTERLLRKAPRVTTPSGLLDVLKAAIDLPVWQGSGRVQHHSQSIFRRWLPALSVAVWLFTCVVILAVQSRVLNKLRNENETLRAATVEAGQTKELAAEDQRLAALDQQLTSANAAETERLRAEIVRLSEQLKDLSNLRAENQRLQTELQARTSTDRPEQDFFAKAAEKHERIKCINNLKQLALGARMWSNDHHDQMPETLNQFKGYLSNAQFSCPASTGNAQYKIISPGVSETDPYVVYAQCPIHPVVALVDGSVQQIDNHKLIVRPDGKTVIGREEK